MDIRIKLFLAGTMIGVLGCAGGIAMAGEMLTTHPSHYQEHRPGGSAGSAGISGKTKQARAGSRILVRDEGRLLERWMLNADLSKACSKGRFRQKRDKFFVGIVDGLTYGAAVGGHGSLVDRGKRAENQVVYLFRGQGTTTCRVYHRTK